MRYGSSYSSQKTAWARDKDWSLCPLGFPLTYELWNREKKRPRIRMLHAYIRRKQLDRMMRNMRRYWKFHCYRISVLNSSKLRWKNQIINTTEEVGQQYKLYEKKGQQNNTLQNTGSSSWWYYFLIVNLTHWSPSETSLSHPERYGVWPNEWLLFSEWEWGTQLQADE